MSSPSRRRAGLPLVVLVALLALLTSSCGLFSSDDTSRDKSLPEPSLTPSPIETSAGSGICATSPTVVMPRSLSLAAVTGPTPQSRSTASGWRNDSSSWGRTTSRPSGLATPLATLARNFVLATPTVIGSPTRSRTSRRSRTAISIGVPEHRSIPWTSRNASSIDNASTSGVVSSNTRNTALLASEYADIRGGTTIA